MPSVNTVRGPVDLDRLGRTLVHEHIFVLSPDVMQNSPDIWDEEKRVAEAVQKLTRLKEAGISTIVDPTVLGLGRYIPRVQKVCAQIDLNVIVATGLYTFHDVPFYFESRGPGTVLGGPEPMVEMFVREIEMGIAGTGVRASILKCATDEQGVTPGVERVLRACAQAHRRTGVPITTHSHAPSRNGLEQQRVFLDEGVDLSRVIIGHSGDTTDVAYLIQLADAGSFLGMDRFGIDVNLPTADRVAVISELCRRGYAPSILLSHDASCWIDWFDPIPELVRREMVPNWHYLHISHDVLPMLRESGVTEAQIEQMLVVNPREVFARAGAY